jgi:glycyl-tRNA synthetase beta chain
MEFLLEINVEEMPSSHVRTALEDLKERLTKELAAAKIAVASLTALSTCRRLILVGDFAAGQADREGLVTGPPKSAAYAPDGSPTPAALGFARSKGIDVARLEVVTTERGEYVGFRTVERGKPTVEVLSRAVPQSILSLSFPKMMRWGTGSLKFSRPVRNILCLFDGRLVPFEIDGLAAGAATAGHKIRDPRPILVASFADYKAALRDARVIIDAEERRTSILAQIEALLAGRQAHLYPDPELLAKLANDVECPFVYLGEFSEAYLSLPIEVLSTALREGLKVFSVVRGAKQLPLFLGVADSPADVQGLIRKGNERVLKARLEDARFFWNHDVKTSLKKRAPLLKHVLFQEKLGSYDDKTQRLKKIVSYLCGRADGEKIEKDAVQAAELCKTDLVTDMVREFPSLQGKVGALYARAEGLPEAVAAAIYEHYLPQSLEDASPATLGGALLSLADKLDSIVGVVGVGIQTTGSSDPFGLRRNAQGVCKIVLDRKLNLSFPRLVDKVLAVYGERLKLPPRDITDYVREFFANRLRYIHERQGIRYDLINAGLGAGLENILHVHLRIKALDALKASPQFEPFILMAKRVNNILAGQPAGSLNADLFVEKEERELYSTFSIVKENAGPMIAKGDFAQAQKMVFRLQPGLNAFFDKVLVMAKETKIRKNRLGLLQAIRKILVQMADYSQVVVEGEKAAGPR